MNALAGLLHHHPELALFVSIALGHALGAIHYKGIGFGNVVGTLLAGLLVGVFAKPQFPDMLRWCFFYLFLFSIGHTVGPQFFSGLKRESLPQIALAVVVAVSGLAASVAVSLLFDFDLGTAVGVLSGGLTTSAALGAGLNAIQALPLSEALKSQLIANAPLADAITYIFGDVGLILFLTVIGPRLMRADLRAEARAIEQQLAGSQDDTSFGALFAVRGYRIESAAVRLPTVAELEQRFRHGRLSVQRIQRAAEHLPIEPGLALAAGDAVVVAARLGAYPAVAAFLGQEVLDDPALLSVQQTTASVVVTGSRTPGKTLEELAMADFTRGVYVGSVHRGQEALPRQPGTRLERGDVLEIVGAPHDVQRAALQIGFVERDLDKTDLALLATGISLGFVLGIYKVDILGVPLTVGTAGAILVMGLIAGWARGRYPVFGAMPAAAQRVLADLGLVVFVALIGLSAGPHAVDALVERGPTHFATIFVAGMVVTLVPLLVGSVVARRLLKMSPLMMLGGMAGAQTCPPALSALREASGSNVAALAYTVPYAVGYIVITLWGPVLVAVLHALRP